MDWNSLLSDDPRLLLHPLHASATSRTPTTWCATWPTSPRPTACASEYDTRVVRVDAANGHFRVDRRARQDLRGRAPDRRDRRLAALHSADPGHRDGGALRHRLRGSARLPRPARAHHRQGQLGVRDRGQPDRDGGRDPRRRPELDPHGLEVPLRRAICARSTTTSSTPISSSRRTRCSTATIERIERRDGSYLVTVSFARANEVKKDLAYDRVIVCTGFRFDASIFAEDCRPELVIDDRFPAQTSAWESTNVPDLYFAGTLMQVRDFKKSTSGFIHGFRYCVRALHRMLERSTTASPGRIAGSRPIREALMEAVIARVNRTLGAVAAVRLPLRPDRRRTATARPATTRSCRSTTCTRASSAPPRATSRSHWSTARTTTVRSLRHRGRPHRAERRRALATGPLPAPGGARTTATGAGGRAPRHREPRERLDRARAHREPLRAFFARELGAGGAGRGLSRMPALSRELEPPRCTALSLRELEAEARRRLDPARVRFLRRRRRRRDHAAGQRGRVRPHRPAAAGAARRREAEPRRSHCSAAGPRCPCWSRRPRSTGWLTPTASAPRRGRPRRPGRS